MSTIDDLMQKIMGAPAADTGPEPEPAPVTKPAPPDDGNPPPDDGNPRAVDRHGHHLSMRDRIRKAANE